MLSSEGPYAKQWEDRTLSSGGTIPQAAGDRTLTIGKTWHDKGCMTGNGSPYRAAHSFEHCDVMPPYGSLHCSGQSYACLAYMPVYVHVSMHARKHVLVHASMHEHMHTRVCTHMRMRACTGTCIRACARACAHVRAEEGCHL